MEHARLVLACVLNIVTGGDPIAVCNEPAIQQVADAVVEASIESYLVPPDIMAALIFHESSYDQRSCSIRGAAGLTQILRHGAVTGVYLKMSFRQLCQVYVNVHIGAAYLATIVPKCSGPTRWLTQYDYGGRVGCVPSSYSRGILKDLKMGRQAVATLVFTEYLARQINALNLRVLEATVHRP